MLLRLRYLNWRWPLNIIGDLVALAGLGVMCFAIYFVATAWH
jgi:hypothetical protein